MLTQIGANTCGQICEENCNHQIPLIFVHCEGSLLLDYKWWIYNTWSCSSQWSSYVHEEYIFHTSYLTKLVSKWRRRRRAVP